MWYFFWKAFVDTAPYWTGVVAVLISVKVDFNRKEQLVWYSLYLTQYWICPQYGSLIWNFGSYLYMAGK